MDREWSNNSGLSIRRNTTRGSHIDARLSGDIQIETERVLNQCRRDELIMQNTAHSLELFFRVFNNEVESLRLHIRDIGIRMRRFFSVSFRMDFVNMSQWIAWFLDRSKIGIKPIQFEYDTPRNIENPSKVERNLSVITFNDIEAVLTKDEVPYGITHSYAIHFPAWKSLPNRDYPLIPEFKMNEFQPKPIKSFNKPVVMTADDEEERLSLLSSHTMATEHESKILSLEAQLAVLSRQMQDLLKSGAPNMKGSPSSSESSVVSDDEGKGTSLCSPATTRKERHCFGRSASLPQVAPPPGPPPPPPPPEFLRPNRPVSLPPKRVYISSEMLPDDTAGHCSEIARPTVFDLRAVQLKKTNTARSPGGTPITRGPRAETTVENYDQECYLVRALREKFRSMNNSFSEHEDDSAWADDED